MQIIPQRELPINSSARERLGSPSAQNAWVTPSSGLASVRQASRGGEAGSDKPLRASYLYVRTRCWWNDCVCPSNKCTSIVGLSTPSMEPRLGMAICIRSATVSCLNLKQLAAPAGLTVVLISRTGAMSCWISRRPGGRVVPRWLSNLGKGSPPVVGGLAKSMFCCFPPD
jgi:hypothetical protein